MLTDLIAKTFWRVIWAFIQTYLPNLIAVKIFYNFGNSV